MRNTLAITACYFGAFAAFHVAEVSAANVGN